MHRLSALVLTGAVSAAALAPARGAVAQNVTLAGAGTFASAPTTIPALAGFTAGAFTFSTVLPKSPSPVFGNGYFALHGVTFTFYQGPAQVDVLGGFTAFASSLNGGFRFDAPDLLFDLISGPVYTGPVSAPTFQVGSYAPLANFGVGAVTGFSIADAATTAPEPGTWALLGTGLLAIAGAAARRGPRARVERPA